LPTASETIADPHNWLFDIAACCSLPVLALVLVALAMILMRNFASLRQQLHATASELPSSESAVDSSNATDADLHQHKLVQALWMGAGAGWLLTAALQWLLQEAVDLEAAAWGLVITGTAFVLMRRGREPSEAMVRGAGLAAVVTMLVCLLATGSWQASGISLPLVAWLAVSGSGGNRGSESVAALETGASQSDRNISWQPVAMIALLIGFIFQTWRPVNSSWTFEQQALAAMQRGDMEAARHNATGSQAADPINPMPYRLVAQTLVYQAQVEPAERLEASSERADTALEQLLECDPVSNLNWNFAAESMMTLAAAAQRPHDDPGSTAFEAEASRTPAALTPLARRLLERAVHYQQSAVERYPSSVALHAQLGVILALLERTAESQQEVERAFALSEATPHLDRKMKKQQIWLPAALAVFPPSAIERPSPESGWTAAEPLCRLLRNKQ